MKVRRIVEPHDAIRYTGEYQDYLDILRMMRSDPFGATCSLSMWERDTVIFVLSPSGQSIGRFDKGDVVIHENNMLTIAPLNIVSEEEFEKYYETL